MRPQNESAAALITGPAAQQQAQPLPNSNTTTPASLGWPSTLRVTIGAGLDRPQGKSYEVSLDRFEALPKFFADLQAKGDAWWAANTWRGNRRSGKNWQEAGALVVDLDWEELFPPDRHEKREPTPEDRERVEACFAELPAQAWYRTKHGWRVIALLTEPVDDPELFKTAAGGFDALLAAALADYLAKIDTGEPGIVIDPTIGDMARVMRRPKCRVKTKDGKSYTLKEPLHVRRVEAWTAKEFANYAPPKAVPEDGETGEDGPGELIVPRPDGSRWRVGRPNSEGRFVVELLTADGDIIASDRIDPDSSISRRRLAKAIANELGAGEIEDFDRELRALLSRSDLPVEVVKKRKSAADILLELIKDSTAEFWHDDLNNCYLTAEVDGVLRNWRLESKPSRAWLARLYYEATDKAIGRSGIDDALNFLDSRARFDGEQREVAARFAAAEDGSTLYLDLGREDGLTVKVTAAGWQLTPPSSDEAHRFVRAAGMKPMPDPAKTPDPAATLAGLWGLVHVEEEDRPLLVAWLLAALAPRGPFLHLALTGPAGSAKSTTSRILRSIIDPNVMPLRKAPRDTDALIIAAKAGRLIVLDNLRRIPGWLSDDLCRLSTGGGLSKRKLYTDDDEVILNASRPCIMNGIGAPVTAPDLLDRTLSIVLKPIPEDQRRTESDLEAAFAKIQPALLGLLLNAAALALSRLDKIKFKTLPRMAEAATWIEAGAAAIGLADGEFVGRMSTQRTDALVGALDATPFGAALVALLDERDGWQGTASELLDTLNFRLDSKRTPRQWPATAHAIRGEIAKLTPALMARGHRIERRREGRACKRILIISGRQG